MNAEKAQWILLGLCWFLSIIFYFVLKKEISKLKAEHRNLAAAYKAASKLIFVETKRRTEHLKAVKRLTDPESIVDDMEKGARLREMYDANRTTLPREDAGPPAKVYTPTMRAKVPRGNYKRESPKD